MSELSPKSLLQILPAQCRHIFVGYSGGLDSLVLLHLCASLADIKDKITAVYVHHGLQKDADDWGGHCRQQCRELGIDFKLLKIDATPNSGEGPEAAARNARYSAFKGLMQPDDVLLVAQHREDQLETLLLQLFRGSGLPGLSAMPVSMVFGQGLLLRPLLNTPKEKIEQYALRHQLMWVEDPSNKSCDYDRNYLRNQILPLLKSRWPSLDKAVARSAQHCADAVKLIDDLTARSFQSAFDPVFQTFAIDELQQYSDYQRDWLLRQWIQAIGLKPPSQMTLQTLIDQVIHAKQGASPELYFQGRYIRKYRQKLYCISSDYFRKEAELRHWHEQEAILPLSNGYCLRRIDSSFGISRRLWHEHKVTVSSRIGGEKIKLPGKNGHHGLKKLFQEAGIPPWERDMRPLVYLNGRLAAVAGLWIDEWAWSHGQDDCYSLCWQPISEV